MRARRVRQRAVRSQLRLCPGSGGGGRPGTAILQICSYFILIGFVWLLIDVFLIPGMVRENQSALRQRLRNEALAAHGQAPANPYAGLASYHDPNIVS